MLASSEVASWGGEGCRRRAAVAVVGVGIGGSGTGLMASVCGVGFNWVGALAVEDNLTGEIGMRW